MYDVLSRPSGYATFMSHQIVNTCNSGTSAQAAHRVVISPAMALPSSVFSSALRHGLESNSEVRIAPCAALVCSHIAATAEAAFGVSAVR